MRVFPPHLNEKKIPPKKSWMNVAKASVSLFAISNSCSFPVTVHFMTNRYAIHETFSNDWERERETVMGNRHSANCRTLSIVPLRNPLSKYCYSEGEREKECEVKGGWRRRAEVSAAPLPNPLFVQGLTSKSPISPVGRQMCSLGKSTGIKLCW